MSDPHLAMFKIPSMVHPILSVPDGVFRVEINQDMDSILRYGRDLFARRGRWPKDESVMSGRFSSIRSYQA